MRERHAGCLSLLVLGAVLTTSWASPLPRHSKPRTCGYESCPVPRKGKINVHLVPHSHDDVGWLKTFDQYYYGSNTRYQRAGVQYILDSVVNELSYDTTKRFIQVETAFFAKWWKETNYLKRNLVKKLVNSGQLEFVGGSWSMADEGVTNYQSTVDQFTWGYRFLNDTFGSCAHPRVAWQIDPFGHSRGFGTMFAQMGLDGVFNGRIDVEDKENRINTRTLEMIWKTSPNLGKQADLFTATLFNTYSPPPGFCFDDLCRDDPIIDDKESPDYNVDIKLDMFAKYVEKQSAVYSDNILLTMGDDFHYQSAGIWYKNLDKLIHYVNKNLGDKMHAFYSTPSCYLKALHASNKTWTTKEDDFFPFSIRPRGFFTGYYTSRPTQKYLERLGNNFLQVGKQLCSLTSFRPAEGADITTLREAVGVLQHHDAITGTERQHVADDYARLISKGLAKTANTADMALKELSQRKPDEQPAFPPEFKSCFNLNSSQCDVTTESENFVVTVYNALALTESTYVRVPVPKGTYSVRDPQGNQKTVQLVPIPESVVQSPGRKSTAEFELVFYAEQLPPIGFRSYYVQKTGDELPPNGNTEPVNSFKIGFESAASAEIDSATGLLKKVTQFGVETEVKQSFRFYPVVGGESGAYVFNPPKSTEPVGDNVTIKVYKGELVEEIHQTHSDYVSQVIRTYAKENHIEFNWQVGPIPIDDSKGKEVISLFETPFNTESLFYTDANGRENLQRKRGFRPTWNTTLEDKFGGNYHPISTVISIRDAEQKKSLQVLVDRGEGGSSIEDGTLELMVHRRLMRAEGVLGGEFLNETEFNTGLVVRGTHYLLAGDETPDGQISLAAQERLLARRLRMKTWLFFSNATDVSFEDWQTKYNMEFSGLSQSLPPNVHLMTLEPWKGNTILVRLEHLFEKNEDEELSKPATVNLQEMLKPFLVVNARETTLAANKWLSESHRLEWNTASTDAEDKVETTEFKMTDEFNVALNPMDIRTFVVEIQQ